MGLRLPLLPVHTLAEKVLFFKVQRALRLGRRHPPSAMDVTTEYNRRVADIWLELMGKAVRVGRTNKLNVPKPDVFFKTLAHIVAYQVFYDRSNNALSTMSLFRPNERLQSIAASAANYQSFGAASSSLAPIRRPLPSHGAAAARQASQATTSQPAPSPSRTDGPPLPTSERHTSAAPPEFAASREISRSRREPAAVPTRSAGISSSAPTPSSSSARHAVSPQQVPRVAPALATTPAAAVTVAFSPLFGSPAAGSGSALGALRAGPPCFTAVAPGVATFAGYGQGSWTPAAAGVYSAAGGRPGYELAPQQLLPFASSFLAARPPVGVESAAASSSYPRRREHGTRRRCSVCHKGRCFG